MLVQPFQKIEVMDSSKQCKAESIGYLSYIRSLGTYNTIEQNIIFIKFGKSGIPRISLMELITPIVDIRSLDLTDNDIALLEKAIEDYFMPKNYFKDKLIRINRVERGDNDRDQFLADNHIRQEDERPIRQAPVKKYTFDSRIKAISSEIKDLANFNTFEFMAYLSALSIFIGRIEGIVVYPKRFRVRNEFANIPIAEVDIAYIGCFICEFFKNASGAFDDYVYYFDSIKHRKIWVDKLRKRLSIDRQAVIRYSTTLLNEQAKICSSLREIAKNLRIKTKI